MHRKKNSGEMCHVQVHLYRSSQFWNRKKENTRKHFLYFPRLSWMNTKSFIYWLTKTNILKETSQSMWNLFWKLYSFLDEGLCPVIIIRFSISRNPFLLKRFAPSDLNFGWDDDEMRRKNRISMNSTKFTYSTVQKNY